MAKEEIAENVSEEITTQNKSKKKKVIIAVVVVLVAALLGVGGYFGYKMFVGHNPAKVTTNAIRNLKDKIEDVKDESDGLENVLSGDAFEVDGKLSVSLPGAGEYTANFDVQADLKNQIALVDGKAAAGKTEIIDGSAYLEGTKLYFKLNDTMKKYYSIDISKYLEELKEELTVSAEGAKNVNTDYDVNKLINYIADAVENNLSKKDFDDSKEKITINGKEISATKYTAKISQTKAKAIADEFLKSVKGDKELLELVVSSSEDFKDVDELKEYIDKFIEEEVKDDGSYLEYSVYVKTSGDVVGYEFSLDKDSILIGTNDDVVEVTLVTGGEKMFFAVDTSKDDTVKISIDAAGVQGSLTITNKLETVKKNKSYKYSLTIDGKLKMNGAELSANLSFKGNVKAIDKVEKIDTKSAISFEKMNDEEQATFFSELMGSSFYSFASKLSAY